MNKLKSLKYLSVLMVLITHTAFAQTTAQKKEPWTEDQLMEPVILAETLKDSKLKPPVIISVAPAAVIPGSIDIGPTSDKANIEKLKAQLRSIPKDTELVIYCGCCPFEKCPNVRPAFTLLNEMGFKNQKLLNIRNNIKTDWINQGYPVQKLK